MTDYHLDLGKSLKVLNETKLRWRLPEDNVAEEVLIPALRVANNFDCMVGFFGGEALKQLAPGLASFISRSRNPMRLLISPNLTENDLVKIREGIEDPDKVLLSAFGRSIRDEYSLSSALAKHTLHCLAYLIAAGRLEIKIVDVTGGLFHPKEWIIRDEKDTIVLSGSANFTGNAIMRNIESLYLHRSWRDKDNFETCGDSVEEFERLWSNRGHNSRTIELPEALYMDFIKTYSGSVIPSEEDYFTAEIRESEGDSLNYTQNEFRIPTFVNVFDGQYEHQGRAVKSWEKNGNKGILAMATGSGKTISALVAAHRLFKNIGQLIIIISVPTRPLVTQWKHECQEFGLNPIACPEFQKSKRLKLVQNAIDNVEFNVTNIETIITTNEGVMDAEFQKILSSTTKTILFIADEVHNLGGNRKFISDPPYWANARLGLSATPIRQYDEDGTQSLIDYFGDVIFEFSLDEAIGVCLVPYDYHLHSVNLSFEECERYAALSEKIRLKVARAGGEIDKSDSSFTVLLNQRRLVLETATSKIDLLSELIDDIGPENIKRSLFYATDKDPKQLELVNSLLSRRGIRWHQITEEETNKGHLLDRVMTSFSDGTVGALTAKRVLDEGLNVPQIDTAFILASTTVEKQWIQRRGRVLRPSKATGKTHATIHDFLVLPPPEYGFDDETRNLVKSELVRCEEFARLSRNRASFGGPYAIINEARFRYLVEN